MEYLDGLSRHFPFNWIDILPFKGDPTNSKSDLTHTLLIILIFRDIFIGFQYKLLKNYIFLK